MLASLSRLFSRGDTSRANSAQPESAQELLANHQVQEGSAPAQRAGQNFRDILDTGKRFCQRIIEWANSSIRASSASVNQGHLAGANLQAADFHGANLQGLDLNQGLDLWLDPNQGFPPLHGLQALPASIANLAQLQALNLHDADFQGANLPALPPKDRIAPNRNPPAPEQTERDMRPPE